MTPEEVRRGEIRVRKAYKQRERYHKMSAEQKAAYNRKRSENYRKKLAEEDRILSLTINEITDEMLEKGMEIFRKRALRAEKAKLRYRKLTAEQRKVYNSRRFPDKKKEANNPQD